MAESSPFADFLRRIRSGDGRAAEELVRKYEPLVRREVRLKLDDRQLDRLFDSMDICQSVMKSFFVRTAAGQYDLDEPGQLIALLVTMARNKLASAARREQRDKRDMRRVTGTGDDLQEVFSAAPSPSQAAASQDLLAEVRNRLTADERALADLRGQGLGWDEIAARVGGNGHARRVQFARAMDRVAAELGIDENGDE